MRGREPAGGERSGGLGFGVGAAVGDFAGADWRAEEPPLSEVAIERLQEGDLFCAFDAFGDDADVEIVSEGGDGLNEGGVSAAAQHVGDERAVDLDRVDGKLVNIGEGRVTGAEVVEGEFEPSGLERVKLSEAGLDVAHDGRLGDFEADGFGRNIVTRGDVQESVAEVVLGELLA